MRGLLFHFLFTASIVLGACQTDRAQTGELIMPEILNLPRHKDTARIDECENIHIGRDAGTDFYYHFCEKLRPSISEDRKYEIAKHYAKKMEELGWIMISDTSKHRSQYYLQNTSIPKKRLTLNIRIQDVKGCSNGFGTTIPCIEQNGEFRQIMFNLSERGFPSPMLNYEKVTYQFNVTGASYLSNNTNSQQDK